MKHFFLILATLTVVSCNQSKSPNNSATSEQTPVQSDNEVTNSTTTSFDINSISFSDADMGIFPFLSPPDGYKYMKENNRKYEEKYFFYNDSMIMIIGGKYHHAFVVPDNGEEFSETYIVKNYEQAIKKLGGIEVYSGESVSKLHELNEMAYAKDMYNIFPYKYKQFVVRTPNGNAWFEICYGLNCNAIDFTVVYEGKMEETVKIIKADELKDAIDKDGKAVLYINFDFDKATLKPDGIQAVQEIANLMQNDASLKLSIEGHTDNTGAADHNKKLSLDRAQAVVNKLIELNINADRLKATGFGADKPLVTNDSDENKAKNRRVEIVKIK